MISRQLTRILIFILFVSKISGRKREKRSATLCPENLASEWSEPTFQVFLTVSSLARVNWDGSVEKRQIELNWINPANVNDSDFIGLYRDDPEWFGATEPLTRVPATFPGGYYLTSIEFPELSSLHHSLLDEPISTSCIHNYWIAYVRHTMVLAVNCLKIQPSWMSDMSDVIGSLPLHALMIPGTHNSGSYDKFNTYGDDTVVKRYTINQGEDVWTQLLFGIRYLDLRVSYYDDTPEKFWLVHDFIKLNPLYETVHAVKRFLRLTNELVIMDFHRFPFGFTEIKEKKRHNELIDYLKSELGEFMAPDWLGREVSLNNLWHMNKTLVVKYEDDLTAALHDNVWPEALHSWGDRRDASSLFRFLRRTMLQKRSATYMWVAMTHLTPSPIDVLLNLSGGIRQLNDLIARPVTKWYRERWWSRANIVATDFLLSNNLVEVAREANRRRRVCRDGQAVE